MIINTSLTNTTTIIIDCFTLFILLGMVYYTSLFRKRGRLDDRIFFIMEITTIILTAADAMNYALVETVHSFAAAAITIGDTIFTLNFCAFPLLLGMYFDVRINKDWEQTKKRLRYMSIPFLIDAALVIINLFTGILFSVEKGSNIYTFGKYYDLIYLPLLVYLAVALRFIFKLEVRAFMMVVFLILVRVFFRMNVGDVSSTSFTLALILCYCHIYAMNDPFYEETVPVKGDQL